MAKPLQPFMIFVLFQFLFFSNIIILGEAKEDSDLMELGNHALAAGKYESAENFFKKVLEAQPGNYLATRELAKVKIKLNKLNEALSLLNDLLNLPIAKGR
ncbi:MAG TPA: tetratricopeptide repeat protein, partial [Nitrospinaceae bacterium]|nr:tetratricopeptide repeat protein [Nitrospinaceae bacterium]